MEVPNDKWLGEGRSRCVARVEIQCSQSLRFPCTPHVASCVLSALQTLLYSVNKYLWSTYCKPGSGPALAYYSGQNRSLCPVEFTFGGGGWSGGGTQ